MPHSVIVASPDRKQRDSLCEAARASAPDITGCDSLVTLKRRVHEGSVTVVILDIDNLPVDNRFLRNLKKEYPGLYILAVSEKTFHPELKESMSSHYIYACLAKPVDPEELNFWLRSICTDERKSGS